MSTEPRSGGRRVTRPSTPKVVFVEVFRLLLVIAGVLGGLRFGGDSKASSFAPVLDACIGALVAYVAGGVVGRLADRGMASAVDRLRAMPAAEVFAGSVVGTAGLLVGLVAGLPVFTLVHSRLDEPLVAAWSWMLCVFGARLGIAKGRDLARSSGISRLIEQPMEPAAAGAFLVDTSAVLDRMLLVLGQSGLLSNGVVIPRFVIDEVNTLLGSPDPLASRQARRGMESLDALRVAGVPVSFDESEFPQIKRTEDQLFELARRLDIRVATASSRIAAEGAEAGVMTLDIRGLASLMSPYHPPGEHLEVELVKEGSQSRQGVGYLPNGEMVVVNDALHLLGSGRQEVVVSSSRQTTQGTLVFAHLPLASEGRLEGPPLARAGHANPEEDVLRMTRPQ